MKSYADIAEALQEKFSGISERTGYAEIEITEMGKKTLGEIGRLPTQENYQNKGASISDDIRSKKETRDKISPFADSIGNNDCETTLGEFYNAWEFLYLLENKMKFDYVFEDLRKQGFEVDSKGNIISKPKVPKEKGSIKIGETIWEISSLFFSAFLSSQAPSEDELRQQEIYREDRYNSR